VKVFVICSVRGASAEYRQTLEHYVGELEAGGADVHLPHRDTDQTLSGLDICKTNRAAIQEADEVHIFYSRESQGTHFDMGVAFALHKPLRVVENEPLTAGKSFPRMLEEWESE
jgi:nucleoside 2-deoxyribosyltransferase